MELITGKILSRQPLSGGDINNVYLLNCEKGYFVLKTNSHVPEDFFEKEKAGLKLLRENSLSVPEVLHVGANHILLEYLEPGTKDEENSGRQLACLHRQPQTHYGLEYDNYIGSLKQENGLFSNWAEFFIQKRIDVQLSLYFNKKGYSDNKIWEALRKWILKNVTPEKAVLLHGDIWSGNMHYSQKGPYFLDPAVYRGDYLVDLAFSEMFGGFSQKFYKAYDEINPIDKNYMELKSLYQIYPLLVHANLFGGGYYPSALAKARKYI